MQSLHNKSASLARALLLTALLGSTAAFAQQINLTAGSATDMCHPAKSGGTRVNLNRRMKRPCGAVTV